MNTSRLADTLPLESDAIRHLHDSQHLATMGSWEFDFATGKFWWSDEAYRIFELDPKSVGDSYEEFLAVVHPDDRNFLERAHLDSVKHHASYNINHRLRFADGRIKHINERCEPFYDAKGHPTRFIGSIQDITEHLEIQEQYRIFFERTGMGVVIIEKDGTLSLVNQAFADFAKSTPETLMGKSFLIGVHDNDKDRLWEYHQQRIRGETVPERYEFDFVAIDGEQGTALINAYFLQQTSQTLISAIDITDRKAKENQLLQSAKVFENLIEGIIITDNQTHIIAVNPAFTKITGFEREEVLGKSTKILQSGEHDEAFYQRMWEALDRSGEWQGEIWNKHKNGEIYPELLSISTIDDSEGQVVNYIAVFSDISKIKKTEEKLWFLAHHDPLTHLPNRLMLQERLEHVLEKIDREQSKVALLFIDLDRFKEINDSFGHPSGDLLLQTIAKRLSILMRREDTIARISGDEFVILIENVKQTQSLIQITKKILQEVSRPIILEEHEVTITASIGIAMGPANGHDATTLLKNADTALYRAKASGRDNFEFFSQEMSQSSFELLLLHNALRNALKRNEFTLYYQPQVDIWSQEVLGTEALLRWDHPDLGSISPEEFIPIAEDMGLINAIGEWVLYQACTQMKQWIDAGISLTHIAVNLSGKQLEDPKILPIVQQALIKTGLDAKFLELEITESTLINEKAYMSVLETLKALGIRISIDDFGTGYSSLSRLKHLPIDKLKIDRSFIQNLINDTDNKAIIKTIIALARNLKLDIIAEGVETQEEADFLLSQGCHKIQGFLHSKPLTAQELEVWLIGYLNLEG